MAFYRVTLQMQIGLYEKYVTSVQCAACAEDAEYQALCDETHNTALTFNEWCSGVEWDDDCMIYAVYATKEISEQTYNEMIQTKQTMSDLTLY